MSSRRKLNFFFEGVNSRDVALFTSYVRVLNFRLCHQWCHEPAGVHLIIYGKQKKEDEKGAEKSSSVFELILSDHERGEEFLALPLNSSEIEIALNRIGNLICETNSEPRSFDTTKRYRLLRWPPNEMLNSANHIRLSTIMTKHFISLEQLHERSGLELSQCRQFLETMITNDLIEVSQLQEAKEMQSEIEKKDTSINDMPSRLKILSLIRSNLTRFSRN